MVIKNKYNAKKITVDGIKFDSKAEAAYYRHLNMLVKAGEVIKFEMQVPFELQEGFSHPTKRNKSGTPKKVPAMKYVADFVVRYRDGTEKVIDVKGMQTQVFKMKAQMFLKKYGPLYLVKRNGSFWIMEEF
ncbi:DUF1064 domain-containing protein [Aerococcus viridans]|uniref:DUF1064 domain-containing protein n=1 Tax=Aerococcus viridans TaxID=1377 RepID=UPI000A98AE79|nr:DUF1064 domain-containing protein [Aerococcus viridans]MCT1798459.1 DUF1064 domain-containing protein [Aerococcus viridans]